MNTSANTQFPFNTHAAKRYKKTLKYIYLHIQVHSCAQSCKSMTQWTLPFYVSTFKTLKSMLLGVECHKFMFSYKKHLNCMFSGEWPINSTSWMINLCIENLRISTDDEKWNLHTTHRQVLIEERTLGERRGSQCLYSQSVCRYAC
jgi:hypothetical protein